MSKRPNEDVKLRFLKKRSEIKKVYRHQRERRRLAAVKEHNKPKRMEIGVAKGMAIEMITCRDD